MMMENYQSSEKKMILHQTSETKSMSVHNNNSFIKPESTPQKNAHSTHLRTLRPPRTLRSQSTHGTGTLKPIYVP